MPDVDFEAYDQGLQELQRMHARDALRVICARDEAVQFAAMAAGVLKEAGLTWSRSEPPGTVAAAIDQIRILRSAGDAATFDLEIRAKSGGTNLDLVYAEAGCATPYNKQFAIPLPFLSEEALAANRVKIWVAITPVGGVNPNSYKARVYAKPLR
jgi:hypothetical protein